MHLFLLFVVVHEEIWLCRIILKFRPGIFYALMPAWELWDPLTLLDTLVVFVVLTDDTVLVWCDTPAAMFVCDVPSLMTPFFSASAAAVDDDSI